jgi:hypothetical protein
MKYYKMRKDVLFMSDSKIIFAMSVLISMMGVIGFLTPPITTTIALAQSPTNLPKNSNATVATNSSSFLSAVDSFESPQGYAIAKKHVYDAPLLDVHNYCSPTSGGIMASCLLFDGNRANATLIGIEYVISSEQYASLPEREKPNWTPVSQEGGKDVDFRFPYLTTQQLQGLSKQFQGAYAKLIITWDPKDKLPLYPPQVVVESLVGGGGVGAAAAHGHNETTITSTPRK